MDKTPTIPPEIILNPDVTVASSTDTKVVKKNEILMTFLSNISSKPSYDRCGDKKTFNPSRNNGRGL